MTVRPLARCLVLADAGALPFDEALIGYDGTATGGTPTPTPIPGPSFTAAPSISHDGTPQVGETLTGVAGTIANGARSARQWLLNGSAISGATGGTYVPSQTGSYAYRETATGAAGTTPATSTSPAVTVAAAPSPTPSPSPSAVTSGGSPVTHNGEQVTYG